MEHWTAIVGSNVNFWDLVAIPGERLGANLGTMKEREKRDPSSSYFEESASATTLSLPFF
jgi:hypothetical protein